MPEPDHDSPGLDPAPQSPSDRKQARPGTTFALTIVTVGVTLAAAVLLVLWSWGSLGSLVRSAPVTALAVAGQTENAFQAGVAAEGGSSGAVLDEWRSVRSDHKAVAYTIAQCFGQDVDQLQRSWFSGLLLDLHPNGDHYWSGTPPKEPPADVGGKPVRQLSDLTSYARAVLFLSDAIGRARVQAATGAITNWPQMIFFSWVVVIVSAVGTLFVTLRTSLTDKGRWTVFLTVAAITFSTAGTVLTSAKTFYDPAKAYARNERALLELQKLHQDVMLNFVLSWDPKPDHCDVRKTVADSQQALLARWVGELKDQHEGLVLAATGDIPLSVQRQTDNIGAGPAAGGPAPAPAPPPGPTTTANTTTGAGADTVADRSPAR